MKEEILSLIAPECPLREHLYWYDTIDSTNTQAKRLAASGAPHGTVLIAGCQTGGRGRLGRGFSSPAGMGVYLSVLLRPRCLPEKLMHLTCAAAAAMCRAVEDAAGFRPGIKWTNDLVFEKKKLGGILTELSADPKTGLTDYAIVGIGINCRQSRVDFPPELRDMAASLSMVSGRNVAPSRLAAAMVERLSEMDGALFSGKEEMLAYYRANCVTLGQEIVLVRAGETWYGKALDLDGDGGLLVEFSDGSRSVITSGEVSVRGMYGYI